MEENQFKWQDLKAGSWARQVFITMGWQRKVRASVQNRSKLQAWYSLKTRPWGSFGQYQLGYDAVTSTPKSRRLKQHSNYMIILGWLGTPMLILPHNRDRSTETSIWSFTMVPLTEPERKESTKKLKPCEYPRPSWKSLNTTPHRGRWPKWKQNMHEWNVGNYGY